VTADPRPYFNLWLRFGLCLLGCLIFGRVATADEANFGGNSARSWDDTVRPFLENHCLDCHAGELAEADLDFERLAPPAPDADSLAKWVHVHDKLHAREMPPAEMPQPEDEQRDAILTALEQQLRQASAARQDRYGRVQFRRLHRVEYEHTLQDLFAMPQLEVADMLPADPSAHGFDKVGAALDLSYVQMARYLEAASAAVDKAMALQPQV